MSKPIGLTQEEINKIIVNHQHWLEEDCEGWENMKADLSYANLSGVNLSNANLRYADLYDADLSNVDLRYADLSNADLRYADLSGENLKYANLSNANLSNADLRYADLSGANLKYANLSNADLSNATLSNADLSNATLSNAKLKYTDLYNAKLKYTDLYNANLKYANLSNATLSNAKLSNADLNGAKINHSLACPTKGSFTAWKKADNKIVKLQILEDSKRLSATTSKCRCDKALVLEIQDLEGNKLDIESVRSDYDASFIYKVGEIVCVNDFNENRWNECSTGIHFFIDRQLAVDY